MHRLNVPWGRGHIAEHVANLPDTGGEHPVSDMHVRPDGGQDLGFAHQTPGVCNQIAQHRPGFRLELAPLRATPQAVLSALEGEGAKVQGRDRPHKPSRRDVTASSKKAQRKLKASSGLWTHALLGFPHGMIAGLWHGHKWPVMGRVAPGVRVPERHSTKIRKGDMQCRRDGSHRLPA
jgi:hypothetical protein